MTASQAPVIRISRSHARGNQYALMFCIPFFLIMMAGTLTSPSDLWGAIFWAVFLIVCIATMRMMDRIHRSYKLRLLPSGLRETVLHKTTNWIEPRIARPELLYRSSKLLLKADGESKKLHLELNHFDKPDQLVLIEHCSLFLTPGQQVQHGKKWAAVHAKLLTPPKPMCLQSALRDLHLMWLISVALILGLVQTLGLTFPEGSTVWTPSLINHVLLLLGGTLLVLYLLVAGAWFADQRTRR